MSFSPVRVRAVTSAARRANPAGLLDEGSADVGQASFILSGGAIRRTSAPGIGGWRKALFVALAHNAADPAAYFDLPTDLPTGDDGGAVDI
jgi:KUP system potassium uptake protein